MARKRVDGRFVSREEEQSPGEAADEVAADESRTRVPLNASWLKYCRRLMNQKVGEAMPGIVDKFVSEARKGSIDHAIALMKLKLFDKDEAVPVKPRRSPKNFAARLLAEWNKPPVK